MKHLLRNTIVGLSAAGVVATTSMAVAAPGASARPRTTASPRSESVMAGRGPTVSFDSIVHLTGGLTASTTAGGFAVAGALTDSGTENGSGYFAGGGATPSGPNILHATQTFTGAHGTITISLVGDFGPLPAQTAQGVGTWTITTGTGAYAHAHGFGEWRAVADFTAAQAHTGPPLVTFIFSGIAN
jgi:hypothetical protein